jgi:hypothetical protein
MEYPEKPSDGNNNKFRSSLVSEEFDPVEEENESVEEIESKKIDKRLSNYDIFRK